MYLAQNLKQVAREHIHRLTKTALLSHTVCISILIMIFRRIMAQWKICIYLMLDSIQHSSTGNGGGRVILNCKSYWIVMCGNKMPTRCNRRFLLQILLLAQHISGNIMLIIRSYSLQTGHITLSSTPYRRLENQGTKDHRQQPSVYYSRAPDDGHNGARNMLSIQ
jgi:hypothetical protein